MNGMLFQCGNHVANSAAFGSECWSLYLSALLRLQVPNLFKISA